MITRIVPVLLACCVAACAGSQPTGGYTTTVIPDGCENEPPGYAWKLRVRLNGLGAPVGLSKDAGPRPIPDPENLTVRQCDTVEIRVIQQGYNRSAMVAFDKDPGFKSPGSRPAYLTRRGTIVVPIDKREGKPTEEFRYSIHVDCDDNITEKRCPALDPMIKVER